MKKSFVMTGYVNRGTCNCGCISSNTFWQDGGFGGSAHLSHLHRDIEKYLDELSGAGPGGQGKSHDVKVTVTIESLGEHEHRLVIRNAFSGLGMDDNYELKKDILKVEEPTEVTVLKGGEQFGTKEEFSKRVKNLNKELSVSYLQDIHDAMLLARKTGDVSKLDEAMKSLQRSIDKEED